jgi:hypothetical protein
MLLLWCNEVTCFRICLFHDPSIYCFWPRPALHTFLFSHNGLPCHLRVPGLNNMIEFELTWVKLLIANRFKKTTINSQSTSIRLIVLGILCFSQTRRRAPSYCFRNTLFFSNMQESCVSFH